MANHRHTKTHLKSHFANPEQGFASLCQKLGYTFENSDLLRQALTHRSCIGQASYERLEFLGDALLGFIIAEYLHKNHPKEDEGRLTRMRATLVREKTLAIIAGKLELYRHILLGEGERKSGGRHRDSTLADVVEALIAAIYQDCGDIVSVRAIVLSWYGDLLDFSDFEVQKDAKSRLQEWTQSKKIGLPVYEILATDGEAHNRTFTVRCSVLYKDLPAVIQSANARRIAEQRCAELMINQINLLNERK